MDETPTLREWFEQAPPARIVLFAVASLCTLITNILGWKLMYSHMRAGSKEAEVVIFFPEIRKKVLYQIFWLNVSPPPSLSRTSKSHGLLSLQVLSGTAYCGLLLPRTSLFLEFLMAA